MSRIKKLLVSSAASILLAGVLRKRRNRKYKRSCWVKPWMSVKRRHQFGAYHALMKGLQEEDPTSLKNFLRMDKPTFDQLLEKVSPFITRQDTIMRPAISAGERLALTLRFLASGNTYTDLQYLYRVPKSTLANIIPETADAIYKCLKDEYMKTPRDASAWEKIAEEFGDQWNFPQCLGAMDGKHIELVYPMNSSSTYYNYKHAYSTVLLALVDADYKFTYVDVGCNGRVSDGGVFKNSSLYRAITEGSLNLPTPQPLPGSEEDVPFVIIGDEAFPLKPYLLKPYPARALDDRTRIYNYRLSRARRIVENAFGILASRFGVFKKPIPLAPRKAEMIVLAACALHNYLRCKTSARDIYAPPGSFDTEDTETLQVNPGDWRHGIHTNLRSLGSQSGNRCNNDARLVREHYCTFVNTDGQVDWQWKILNA